MLIHYRKLIFAAFIFSLALSPMAAHGSPPVITDGSINETVEDELWRDQGIHPEKIDVHTTEGIVRLSGKVTNSWLKKEPHGSLRP